MQVLLDPNELSEDGTLALSVYAVSKDAKYLAYALNSSGSDWDEKPCAYYMRTGAYKFGIACIFHHPQPDPAVSVTGPFHYRSTDSSGYLMEVDFLHGRFPKQHTCMLLIQEVRRPTCQLFILPLKGCYLHQNGTLTWIMSLLK
uniref:C3H1-type domain-containing protein n=1 Tax=Daucus carota subsp. sativus TaxID=79200 RepID=A0A164UWI7_DAUCS